jgi:hypothetical protein
MFNNSILLINFNYSKYTNNKEFLKKLYQPYFKSIFFYSDLPATQDEEINFVNTQRGCFTHRIFVDFFEKYQEQINQTDGVFYIHDDCILNVKKLNCYSSSDIIYYNEPHTSSQDYSNKFEESAIFSLSELPRAKNFKWPHWKKHYGIQAIQNIKNNPIKIIFKNFSDFFYLPLDFINQQTIDLFKLYKNVFLEIAIPSIIYHMTPENTNYQEFSSKILWNKDRDKLSDINFLKDTIKNNLITHPIKFNINIDYKKYIMEILK